MMLRCAVSGAGARVSPNPSWAWNRLASVFTAALLLLSSACTSTAPERNTAMPWFDTVAIQSMGATTDLKARFGVAPEDEIIQETAVTGAAVGTAAGLGGAAVCRPYFFVCALLTVPATTLVGVTAGSVAGAVSDAHKTPPEKQLMALDKLFVDIYRQRTLHVEIRDTLEKQVPPDRLADPAEAGALVQLKLHDVRFTRTFTGKYKWTLKAVMVVGWDRNTLETKHTSKTYTYESHALSLDEWTKNDGELLNAGLDESVEGLVKPMAYDLRF